MSPTDDYRLFFALWPDERLREQLEVHAHAAVAESGGRRIAPRNYHITLLFMGNVGGAELQQALASASTLRVAAFDLSLDRLESSDRGSVVWLGLEQQPPALLDLVQALWSKNPAPRSDRVLRPHVTLVRDPIRSCRARTVQAVHWAVRDFVLVSSVPGMAGSQYAVIGRWPLQPTA